MSKAVNRTAVNRTAGYGRLWALAALLLAVFLASFFLGRYGVSLSPGQFLGLMAEGLQRALTALVNLVGRPFGFATDRLFTVPVTWSPHDGDHRL